MVHADGCLYFRTYKTNIPSAAIGRCRPWTDVTAETASAVVGQSDSGVASEVAVSIASVVGAVSTERLLICNHCGHELLTFTLNESRSFVHDIS